VGAAGELAGTMDTPLGIWAATALTRARPNAIDFMIKEGGMRITAM